MYFSLTIEKKNYSPRFLNSHVQDGSIKGSNELHTHPVYHVLCLERGRGKTYLNDRFYPVKKGDVLLISPNVPHQFISERKDPFLYSHVTFDLIQTHGEPGFQPFSKIFKGIGLNVLGEIFHLNPQEFKLISKEVRKFVPFGDFPPRHASFYRKSEIMLCNFLNLLGTSLEPYSVNLLESRSKHEEEDFGNKVLHFLQKHYPEKLSLELISGAFSLSPFHFSRKYKKESGRNVMEELMSIRLKIAASLLKHSFFPMKEIASRTGFSDVYYFSKCFKKKFACPPGRFARDPEMEDHFHE